MQSLPINANVFFEECNQIPIVHTNDIGFDADDYWAQYLIARTERLFSVVTTLYKPDEKAAISRTFIRNLHENGLIPGDPSKIDQLCERVFQGAGHYEEPAWDEDTKRKQFQERYPRWPINIFGDPGAPNDPKTYKCVYPYQLEAFREEKLQLAAGSQLQSFIELLQDIDHQVIITATGPLTSEAELLRQVPDLMKEKVKAIFMMNGTFLNPPRMGYNGVLNLKDTETVLNSGIPCIIVPSEICTKFNFPLETVEKLRNEELGPFGKKMMNVLMNWELHRARKKNPDQDPSELKISAPILADPLTAIIAIHPEWIDTMRPVRYQFDDSDPTIHMLHPDAKSLVRVVDDPESGVFEVRSLKNPEAIQSTLEKLIIELFPKAARDMSSPNTKNSSRM
ncbi:MAG: nucleoside hydrolase [Chlamydiia bacterium]|nr:nucleoside hydrolase [Chlamydiia bacterium]